MKGYLSGPMAGYHELNYPLFNAWAATLRGRGHHVFSPSEVPAPPEEWSDKTKVAYFMRFDFTMILDSDCLWMIPGWIYSKGAKIEAAAGMALGLPLLDVDTEEPLPIARIHEVVECSHENWTFETEEGRTFDGEPVTSVFKKCFCCGRYPIYDSTFRIEVTP